MTAKKRADALLREQAAIIEETVTGSPYLQYKSIDQMLAAAVAKAIEDAVTERHNLIRSKVQEMRNGDFCGSDTEAFDAILADLREIEDEGKRNANG